MQQQNSTGIVTRFELLNNLQNRSFQISTLITVVLILLAIFAPKLLLIFQKLDDSRQNLFILNEAGVNLDLESLSAATPDFQLQLQETALDSEAKSDLVQQKTTAGLFIVKERYSYTWLTRRLSLGQAPYDSLAKVLGQQLKAEDLQKSGLPQSFREKMLAAPAMEVIEVAELDGKSQTQTLPYTYILIILLYIAILSYGQLTASSVASEKSSRAMEILITSTAPRHLIHGKILGTGLAGLVQMLVIGLAYYLSDILSALLGSSNQTAQATQAANGLGSQMNFLEQALHMPPHIFFMALNVFVLSYLAFAYIFAALGSLVSRSEEVSQVTAPVSMLYVGIFFAAIMASMQPDKTWVLVCSFLPLIGPLLYFVRYAMLNLSLWELLIPLAIHLATVALSATFAIRIYRQGVLHYGNTPRFRDLAKLLRRVPEN